MVKIYVNFSGYSEFVDAVATCAFYAMGGQKMFAKAVKVAKIICLQCKYNYTCISKVNKSLRYNQEFFLCA